MATTTTAIGASDLMRLLQNRISDVVYYHGERGRVALFNMFEVAPVTGGDQISFAAKLQANGSFETYVEGQDPPVAGQGTSVRATQPWTYFRTIAEITGHTDDAARGTDLGPELVRREINDAIRALIAGVQVSFLAASTIGLVGIIDATLAWHGVNRATYTATQSYVQSPAGVLATSHLENIRTNMHDAPRMARIAMYLSRPNQKQRYIAFAPQQASGAGNINVNRANLDGSRRLDIGWDWDGIGFDNAPWMTMGDLANTVVLGLDLSDGAWRYFPHRDFQVDELAKVRDSRIFQMSHAGALVCYEPRRQCKIDTLTP